jgi:hypothetical protein
MNQCNVRGIRAHGWRECLSGCVSVANLNGMGLGTMVGTALGLTGRRGEAGA